MAELVRRRLGWVKPNSPIDRLSELAAVGLGDKGVSDGMCLLAEAAPDQVDTGDDVAPLVRPSGLQLDPAVLVQMAEVVSLEERVAELGEGQTVIAVKSAANRVLGEHLVDRHKLANVAKKVEETDRFGPIGVVDQSRLKGSGLEVKKALQLHFDAPNVVAQRVHIEQVPFVAAARWVANHSSSTARQRHRTMSRLLESPQEQLTYQVANMQRVRRWVEADVHTNGPIVEAGGEGCPVGRVVNQATRIKIGKQVHCSMLPATLPKAALNSSAVTRLTRMQHALSLPPFGVLSDPSALLDVAVAAEERGWDGVFLWDHLLRPVEQATSIADPWIMLSALAMATSRVRIGPMVTPIARRRPLKLAREVATLDVLAKGRVTLCLGLGVDSGGELTKTDEELDPIVRGAMLEEGVVLLDHMLRGEHVVHRGQHFMVDGITLSPTGAQSPRIPFWMAARGANAKPIRRAARYEGLCPTVITPDRFSEIVDIVAAERGDILGYAFAVMTTPDHRLSEYERRGANWAIHETQPHNTMTEIIEIVNRMDA